MSTTFDQAEPQVSLDDLVACPGCDLLHHKHALEEGEVARCDRCNQVIQSRKLHSIDRTLAVVLAGIVLLLVSLTQPFLSLSRSGIESTISVVDAVIALWMNQMQWLGLLTLSFIVLLPLCRLLLLGWVLWRIRFGRRVRHSMRLAFRWAVKLEPWAMADIFMIGVVVSLVKISSMANLYVGMAFWSLLGLVVATVLINLFMCKDTVWAHLSQER